jgi:hypothetical protein
VEDAVVVDQELRHAAGDESEVRGAGEGFLLGGDEGIEGVASGRDLEAFGAGVAHQAFLVGGIGELGAIVFMLQRGDILDDAALKRGGRAELGEAVVEELGVLLGRFEEEPDGVLGVETVLEGVLR